MKPVLGLFLSFLLVIPMFGNREDEEIRAMALKLLLGGEIVEFNQWRDKQPAVPINLSRVSLKGADLREANLAAVDLSEADLSGAKLWKTYLYRADLRGANLSGVVFDGADLKGVNYVYATMSQKLLDEIESQNRRTVIIAK